jgi:two-component system CheB/CheR fusion protein
VLIYLGPALQKRVLPIFHYALKPSGYLLLGNSENISSHSDMFTLVDKKHRIFVTREAPTRLPADFNYGGSKVEAKQTPGQTAKRIPATPLDLHKEADRLILSRYGPPGVIITEEMDVIQFRGQTGAYLEPAPGPASYNILKMARQGVIAELRSSIQRALRDDTPVRSEGLRVRHNDAYETFDLEVIPLRRSPQRGRFFIVLFHPVRASRPKKEEQTKTAGTKDGPSEQIKILEEDLASTKESLQAIIEEQEASNEELRSANEEIQSSNEELQSTNEELETAKEELQSSNEELNTVNEELENRNTQLAQANDDLRNLLSSVSIPIVMVGSDLRIRRFTPQAEKVLSIIPSDTGRPIANIRTNINIPNVEQLLTEVIETLRTHEAEVQDTHGRWYLLRIRPYRTEDNKIEGAVLMLLDIDEMKRTLEEIRRARDLNQSIFETSRSSMLVLEPGSRIKIANPAFYQAFQLTPGEVVGHNIYDLAGGQWKFPKLRSLFEDILSKDGRLDGFEVDHEFPRVGRKKLVVNARRLHTDSGDPQVFLIAMDDIAELAPGQRKTASPH